MGAGFTVAFFFGAAAKSSVPLSDLAVPFPDLAVPLWKSSVPLFLAVGSMFVRPYGYGSTPPWVAVGVCGVGVPVSVLAASPQRYVRARKRRHTHVPRPPQSLDCVRARPFRVPALFASVRSARGRCGARWHVCVLASASVVAPPTRNRLSRDAPCIRRYGALGLVAMPPCANRIRPGGVLPLAASDSLWPRGRHASPLARYRHLSVSAVRVPRPLQ